MQVGHISIKVDAEQGLFYASDLPREDAKEAVYTIANVNPSKIGTEFSPRTGKRHSPVIVDVDVKKDSIVRCAFKDYIKKGHDVDASYKVTVYLYIDTDEEPEIIKA